MESRFKDFIQGDFHYWVAFSGGLDSHVLLHALATFRENNPFSLRAIHIHHGLSKNADAWLLHCEKICADLNIVFMSVAIEIDSHKNIEEIARKKRYDVFQEILLPNDVLFTAHHEDDQAETVLLQLCRGAGTKGLSAMPRQKKLGTGFHIRPFLSLSRADLEKYASENHLSWIEDESNQDRKFSRNFLRQDVFPLLKKHFGSVNAAISRTATHCANMENLLQEYVMEDFQKVFNEKNNTLSLYRLKKFSEARQTQILRTWLQILHFPLPSFRKMHEILHSFLGAAEDRFPLIQFGNVELRRYRDEVFAYPSTRVKVPVIPAQAGIYSEWIPACAGMTGFFNIPWNFKSSLILQGCGTLTAEKTQGQGLHPSIQEVNVRFREGGEYCYFRNCHQELKKLFQTWGVPPWLRSRIPLLFFEDKLIAVVGYFLDQRFMAGEGECGTLVSLTAFHHPHDFS